MAGRSSVGRGRMWLDEIGLDRDGSLSGRLG